jgi:hypothetical protein
MAMQHGCQHLIAALLPSHCLESMFPSIRNIFGWVSCLSAHVSVFRHIFLFGIGSNGFQISKKKINAAHLNPDMVVGKYIPRLWRSRDYAALIYDQTSSPRLDKVLKKMGSRQLGICEAAAETRLYHPCRVARLPVRFSGAVD